MLDMTTVGPTCGISAELETVGSAAWRRRIKLTDDDVIALFHHRLTARLAEWQAEQTQQDDEVKAKIARRHEARRADQIKGADPQWAK